MAKRERRGDVNSERSKARGFWGKLENFIRASRNLAALAVGLSLLLLFGIIIGLSLIPSTLLVLKVYEVTSVLSFEARACWLALSLGLAFPLFALTLIFVVPLFNKLLPLPVNTYRGPWYSLPTVGWYAHNALTYLVRYTVLDLITPSPLNILFFRMMGMKIGKNVMINTSNISDPALITLGDHVTIGGSATLMAHYGMDGYLVIDRLEIGPHSMVGLHASIFGGVRIGQNAMVAPGAVVYPKTVIGDDEKFGYEETFKATQTEPEGQTFGGEDI